MELWDLAVLVAFRCSGGEQRCIQTPALAAVILQLFSVLGCSVQYIQAGIRAHRQPTGDLPMLLRVPAAVSGSSHGAQLLARRCRGAKSTPQATGALLLVYLQPEHPPLLFPCQPALMPRQHIGSVAQ